MIFTWWLSASSDFFFPFCSMLEKKVLLSLSLSCLCRQIKPHIRQHSLKFVFLANKKKKICLLFPNVWWWIHFSNIFRPKHSSSWLTGGDMVIQLRCLMCVVVLLSVISQQTPSYLYTGDPEMADVWLIVNLIIITMVIITIIIMILLIHRHLPPFKRNNTLWTSGKRRTSSDV